MVLILASVLPFVIANTILWAMFLRDLHHLRNVVAQFITPPAPDKKSPLAEVWDLATFALAKKLVVEFKTTLMGLASGDSRAAKAVENEVLKAELGSRAPMLAAVLEAVPGLSKLAKRSPGLMSAVLNRLSAGEPPAGPPKNQAEFPTIHDDYSARLNKFGG